MTFRTTLPIVAVRYTGNPAPLEAAFGPVQSVWAGAVHIRGIDLGAGQWLVEWPNRTLQVYEDAAFRAAFVPVAR